ncbi:hypothetical protein LCGC14_2073480 [marine sediment metagenome]|uniref:Uncharacterized protein n=1 Tax=marine sediment metagenome TaxID=412755 RepID=A0A0F9HES1_9ZZZZ
MAFWMALPAIAQGVGALTSYLTRPKREGFGRTGQGQILSRLATEGQFSPQAEERMLGMLSKQGASEAARQSASIRGRLTSMMGGGKSIAFERSVREPQRQVFNRLVDYREKLDLSERETQRKAGFEYGTAARDYEMQTRQENRAAISKLIGGVTGAAASGVSAFRQERALKDLGGLTRESIQDRPGEFMSLAQKAGVRLPYGIASIMRETVGDDFDFDKIIRMSNTTREQYLSLIFAKKGLPPEYAALVSTFFGEDEERTGLIPSHYTGE